MISNKLNINNDFFQINLILIRNIRIYYKMKPPVCCICDKELDYPDEGGLIYFKKGPSDKKWDKLMEEEGMVGHPP
ncbi:unnamed protein product, partial [marine sediment metagenome]